jgi:hypothetical protein
MQAQAISQTQAMTVQNNSMTTAIQPEDEISRINLLLGNPHLKSLLKTPNIDTLLANTSGKTLLEDQSIKDQLKTQ